MHRLQMKPYNLQKERAGAVFCCRPNLIVQSVLFLHFTRCRTQSLAKTKKRSAAGALSSDLVRADVPVGERPPRWLRTSVSVLPCSSTTLNLGPTCDSKAK